jgi:hypothetical protein
LWGGRNFFFKTEDVLGIAMVDDDKEEEEEEEGEEEEEKGGEGEETVTDDGSENAAKEEPSKVKSLEDVVVKAEAKEKSVCSG